MNTYQSKRKEVKFTIPLTMMITNREHKELPNIIRDIIEKNCENNCLEELIHYLEIGYDLNDEIFDVIINNHSLHCTLISNLISNAYLQHSIIQLLSILSNNYPYMLLKYNYVDVLTKLLTNDVDYDTYLMILNCFYNLTRTQQFNCILPLLSTNTSLVILSGISNVNGEFLEQDICSEMLLIWITNPQVILWLEKSSLLFEFLKTLEDVYKEVLVMLKHHIILLRLCKVIQLLLLNDNISVLINITYTTLLL
ncbi:hypothetical protein QTN25_003899 [Entamoeba marina]